MRGSGRGWRGVQGVNRAEAALCQGAVPQVGDDLFDDRVAAVGGLRLHERELAVSERGVVAVDGEQLALSLGDAGGVEAADSADQ